MNANELLYRNGDRIITKLKTRDFVKPQQWHDTNSPLDTQQAKA